METKEELRRKFDEHFWYDGAMENTETRILVPFIRQTVFEFLWKEIEAREKELIEISSHTRQTEKTLRMEIYRLESTLEAADEVLMPLARACEIVANGYKVDGYEGMTIRDQIFNRHCSEALEKYNQLKSNQQSPNS